MLKKLFWPAINLMDRFSYSKKFLLLGCLAISVLTLLSFSFITQLHQEINTAQTQLHGIERLKIISTSLQSLQQHRGLVVGQLADNKESLFTNRTAVKQVVNDQFELIENNSHKRCLVKQTGKQSKVDGNTFKKLTSLLDLMTTSLHIAS